MSETENIARMAEEVASEIFPALYWEKVPPINQNWACVKRPEHGREKTKTHPTDAVYRYLHPYTGKHTYIIFDFKTGIPKSRDQKQVDRYKETLENMGIKNVQGYLFYTATGVLQPVS